ncbi:hypothetical protein CDL12_24075 [Handroanthus impetiginosus]|uniref:Uncharacterized protein n=1 Tax=Handroanthus impetiginosus TaxID=429701 RepID=A0A2G9GEG0_9LAMI|nr:hypothetical protein CDL12_24075 [Handroanthus impetiginosus]
MNFLFQFMFHLLFYMVWHTHLYFPKRKYLLHLASMFYLGDEIPLNRCEFQHIPISINYEHILPALTLLFSKLYPKHSVNKNSISVLFANFERQKLLFTINLKLHLKNPEKPRNALEDSM